MLKWVGKTQASELGPGVCTSVLQLEGKCKELGGVRGDAQTACLKCWLLASAQHPGPVGKEATAQFQPLRPGGEALPPPSGACCGAGLGKWRAGSARRFFGARKLWWAFSHSFQRGVSRKGTTDPEGLLEMKLIRKFTGEL